MDSFSPTILEALVGRFVWLEKMIYALDRSRGAGSEAGGEGRERGNLIETTPKPPVAQRAGGVIDSVAILDQ